MGDELSVERSGPCAVLTLNRPERRNALSVALRDAIADVLDELAGDASVQAVVITGAGDVFCAGFDLREVRPGVRRPDVLPPAVVVERPLPPPRACNFPSPPWRR